MGRQQSDDVPPEMKIKFREEGVEQRSTTAVAAATDDDVGVGWEP